MGKTALEITILTFQGQLFMPLLCTNILVCNFHHTVYYSIKKAPFIWQLHHFNNELISSSNSVLKWIYITANKTFLYSFLDQDLSIADFKKHMSNIENLHKPKTTTVPCNPCTCSEFNVRHSASVHSSNFHCIRYLASSMASQRAILSDCPFFYVMLA